MESNFDELVTALANCKIPFESSVGWTPNSQSWIEIRSTTATSSDMVANIWLDQDGKFTYIDIYKE
jgi:hypothetical protein